RRATTAITVDEVFSAVMAQLDALVVSAGECLDGNPFLCRERLNNEVNFEKAELHVAASLREGADLRLKVAGNCGRQIVEAALLISDCLAAGSKLLLFGNGGSAADAQHLAAEFVGRFVVERPGLAAIALTTDSSIL